MTEMKGKTRQVKHVTGSKTVKREPMNRETAKREPDIGYGTVGAATTQRAYEECGKGRVPRAQAREKAVINVERLRAIEGR